MQGAAAGPARWGLIVGRLTFAVAPAARGPLTRASPRHCAQGYPGTHEFLLQDDGKWLHVKETDSIGVRPSSGLYPGRSVPEGKRR